MASSAPTPYIIHVTDEALDELKQRLSFIKFPSQLEDSDPWQFGVPVSEMKRLTEYWQHDFNWRSVEAKLNELPQFNTKVDVDGFGELDIHFVHQVSPVKEAIPLLFSHGWPGSFLEVSKILPLVKGGGGGAGPAFHVVAPSLPNFGFSDGVNKRGFGIAKYAETMHKLMLKLGYTKYVTQGGDWGFSITRAMGYLYPEHCLASHINMVLASPPTFTKNPLLALQHATTPYTARERAGFERSEWFQKEGYGYNSLQSTKPQTISYSLSDSPSGLLAWVYEKLHDWTDSYPWTPDEVLTFVCLYWFSKAGPGSSARIYYEALHPEPHSNNDNDVVTYGTLRGYIPHVKLGIAHFPRDITVVPHLWAETMGEVVMQSVHEEGGHFAAWEVPELLVGDLKSMFGRGGPCFGIVKGRGGYA